MTHILGSIFIEEGQQVQARANGLFDALSFGDVALHFEGRDVGLAQKIADLITEHRAVADKNRETIRDHAKEMV